jgi:hypothetical protein
MPLAAKAVAAMPVSLGDLELALRVNKGLILFLIFLAVVGLDVEYQLHITANVYIMLALGLMWVSWVTPSPQD